VAMLGDKEIRKLIGNKSKPGCETKPIRRLVKDVCCKWKIIFFSGI
jgi:hypothetical protein